MVVPGILVISYSTGADESTVKGLMPKLLLVLPSETVTRMVQLECNPLLRVWKTTVLLSFLALTLLLMQSPEMPSSISYQLHQNQIELTMP